MGIQGQRSWERWGVWIGNIPFTVCLFLALAGLIDWYWAVLAFVFDSVLVGYVLYPWISPQVQTTRGVQCRACGYDLYGRENERCPECGADVPIFAPVARGEN
ncbi:MAG: hypothetical protein AAGE65_12700 [Planctomycetota bacterium]